MIAQSSLTSLRNYEISSSSEVMIYASGTSQNWRSISADSHNDKVESNSLPKTKVLEVQKFLELYQSAKLFCEDISNDRLKVAVVEAIRLMNSGIFLDYVQPNIAVDDCGEFSFTHKNGRGYMDIGVNGTGEISFHVRNDQDPSSTVYGDEAWNGVTPPENLLAGVVSLLQD